MARLTKTTVMLTATPDAFGEVFDLADALSAGGTVAVEIVKISRYHWEFRCGDKVQDAFVVEDGDLYGDD